MNVCVYSCQINIRNRIMEKHDVTLKTAHSQGKNKQFASVPSYKSHTIISHTWLSFANCKLSVCFKMLLVLFFV